MDFLSNWIVSPDAKTGPGAYIAVAFLSVMISSISKGGFGGGMGVISVPLLILILPTRQAIGILLPVLVICDLTTINRFPKQWEPRIFFNLMPGIVAGIAATTYAIHLLGDSAQGVRALETFLQISVAVISVTFVVLQWRLRDNAEGPAWRPGWGAHLPVGFLSGITTTIAHAAGPVVNMYLLPQKFERGVFVGTCGRLFAVVNTLKIPFSIYTGFITLQTFRYGLWMMLVAPPGVALGAWLNKRVSATLFARIVYVSLIVAALKLIIDAVRGH
jgi:uncharacterized protein